MTPVDIAIPYSATPGDRSYYSLLGQYVSSVGDVKLPYRGGQLLLTQSVASHASFAPRMATLGMWGKISDLLTVVYTGIIFPAPKNPREVGRRVLPTSVVLHEVTPNPAGYF